MTKVTQASSEKQAPWFVIAIIIAGVIALAWFFIFSNEQEDIITPIVNEPEIIERIEPAAETVIEAIDIDSIENQNTPVAVVKEQPIEEEPTLPSLDNSDELVQETLPKLTWRKELLKLFVTEDIIRRVVVFVDNFSQGQLAYSHSPLVLPTDKFFAIEKTADNNINNANTTWLLDESSAKRFSLYVDLLRSLDSDTLVDFYFEIKPLIDTAYQELGYPEQDFTDTLQATITQILDLDFPSQDIELIRPSVMYKFKDESLESLDDTDKLFLRLGKENILVIKSILLEINEKLSRAENKRG